MTQDYRKDLANGDSSKEWGRGVFEIVSAVGPLAAGKLGKAGELAKVAENVSATARATEEAGAATRLDQGAVGGVNRGSVPSSGELGIPAVRSTNPLSPVLEFDAHGNELLYRTMSPADFAKLQRTGKLPATGETFISPSQAYSSGYDGVLVRFTTKPGTMQQLADIGVTANPGTASLFPEMQSAAKGWTTSNAMFKLEGNVVNTGLGRGNALTIFNQNTIQYVPIY